MDNKQQHISEQELEAIESYLFNKMDGTEKSAFEMKLQTDKKFREEFQKQRALIEGIEEKALISKLNDFHKPFQGKQADSEILKKPTYKRNRFHWVAASVAVLIGLGSFWLMNKPTQSDRLFSQYFVPDSGLPTTMGKNDNYAFSRAMVDYKYGKYESAIEMWEEQLSQKPKNDTLNYYLGVAHLANGNEKNAISFLKTAVKQEQSVFKDKAFYYLGMALLKQADISSAKENLKKSSLRKSKELISELGE